MRARWLLRMFVLGMTLAVGYAITEARATESSMLCDTPGCVDGKCTGNFCVCDNPACIYNPPPVP